jgi:Protein of Unknown function (DUF2784)
MPKNLLLFCADLILVVHVVFVAFVVLGLPAIWLGRRRGWQLTDSLAFRLAHLGAMAFVALETWSGINCPLTIWEADLRRAGGDIFYEGSFVEFWLHRILFFSAPTWVFQVAYTVFLVLIVLTYVLMPPRRSVAPPAPRFGASP